MKHFIRKYVIFWIISLIVMDIIILILQRAIPQLNIYREAYILTYKGVLDGVNKLDNRLIDIFFNFHSVIHGFIIFNILMIIQLIIAIIVGCKIKNYKDQIYTLPLLSFAKKSLIISIIIGLVFSLVPGIPSFFAIVFALIYILFTIYKFSGLLSENDAVANYNNKKV